MWITPSKQHEIVRKNIWRSHNNPPHLPKTGCYRLRIRVRKLSSLDAKHCARRETSHFRKLNSFITALAKSEFRISVITSKNMIVLPVTVNGFGQMGRIIPSHDNRC